MSAKKKVFLGHAVLRGKIRFSSVKQIKLFDPTSEGCPRKWAFEYLFNKKPKKTGALNTGIDNAEKLEHYLTTGEDVLPPLLQEAKKYFPQPGPDLECEHRLAPDIERALKLRDSWLMAQLPGPIPDMLAAEIKKSAGLTALGIPIDGAADYRHRRGEYVDENGLLVREHSFARVTEIGDLKVIVRINPQLIRKGENAGKTLPGWAKTSAEVCTDVQMMGYGLHEADAHSEVTHVRLSHVYGQKASKGAAKRTGIVSVATLREHWATQVEPIVLKMVDVATAQRIEDVEPNTRACDSYTHVDPTDPEGKRTLKGCAHKYYCPLSTTQFVSNMLGTVKETAMSLFDQVAPVNGVPAAPAAPPPPVMDAAAHAAAVAAEKARLLAEDAGAVVPPPVVIGYCQTCSVPLTAANSSRLQDNRLVHIGCAMVAPPPPNLSAVLPPDAPQITNMLEAAGPVSAEALAQIADPKLRATVEAHNQAHANKDAAEAAAEAAVKGTGAVWCPTSATKIVVTTEMAVSGKYVCACTKSYSLKQLKPIKEGDAHVTVIPRHKPVNKAEESAPPPAPLDPNGFTAAANGFFQGSVADATVNSNALPPVQTLSLPPPPPVVVAPPPPSAMTEVSMSPSEIARLRAQIDRLEGAIANFMGDMFKAFQALAENYKTK